MSFIWLCSPRPGVVPNAQKCLIKNCSFFKLTNYAHKYHWTVLSAFVFENFMREQPVPLKTQRSCKGKQACAGVGGAHGLLYNSEDRDSQSACEEKAAEAAETRMGLRSLTGDMGERGLQVHIKPPKPGKSTQMDVSGRQLAAGKPGRHLCPCIQWRGGCSVVTLSP